MYRAVWLVTVLLVSFGISLGMPAAASAATTFDYAVYLAGSKAGEMQISVDRDGPRYWIEGVMRSVGVLNLLTAWRGRFHGEGELKDGAPVLTRYEFREKDRKNVRQVTISDGVLTQVKNGRTRVPRPAPTGADLLSTFLLPGGCLARTALHLGKGTYELDLESVADDVLERNSRSTYHGAALQCRYQMRDDDATSRATVWVAEVNGHSVPVRIEVDGSARGGLYLL